MKPMSILGIVLIIGGIAGLFISRVSWTETKPLVKAGPDRDQSRGRPYGLDSHRRRRRSR